MQERVEIRNYKLRNDFEIPFVGLGTFRVKFNNTQMIFF